jgi:hypothetical protein
MCRQTPLFTAAAARTPDLDPGTMAATANPILYCLFTAAKITN